MAAGSFQPRTEDELHRSDLTASVLASLHLSNEALVMDENVTHTEDNPQPCAAMTSSHLNQSQQEAGPAPPAYQGKITMLLQAFILFTNSLKL